MRLDEICLRDPFVLAENGTYYMYGTRCDRENGHYADAVDVRFDLELRNYRVVMCNYIAENYIDKALVERNLKNTNITVREAMLRQMRSYGEAGFTPDNSVYQVEVKR